MKDRVPDELALSLKETGRLLPDQDVPLFLAFGGPFFQFSLMFLLVGWHGILPFSEMAFSLEKSFIPSGLNCPSIQRR
jgi:hypothetical protein